MGNPYTNTRPSKVSCGGVNWISHETHNVSDDLAKVLEARDPKTKALTHPLRAGKTPILRPGRVEPPPEEPAVKVASLGDLDLTRALAQVRLCQDIQTLAAWHATETRTEILAAIDQRARELTNKA
jgi:hypothetical protein